MESTDIFVRTLLTDKVKLRPNQLNAKLKEHLLNSLRKKYEGVCSYHGYIKPNSIEVFKYSYGYIQALSLNGDVEYIVNYYADVCHPSVGSIVHTKIVNTNKFGALAHTGIRDTLTGKFIPILEIVIAKNMVNIQNDKTLDEFKVGDEIHVEILGKKFELTDRKISAVGRVVATDADKNILDDAEDEDDQEDNEDPEDEEAPEESEGDDEEDANEDEDNEDEDNDDDNDEKSAAGEDEDDDEDDEDDDEAESQLGGDSDGFMSDGDDNFSIAGSEYST